MLGLILFSVLLAVFLFAIPPWIIGKVLALLLTRNDKRRP